MSGDEFCVVLNAQEESTVRSLICEIQNNLKQSPAHEKFKVSMSLGYACYNGSETLFELLDRADDEMYRIKKEKKQQKL